MDWMGVVSLIFGVLGIGIAVYQGSERRKLQDFIRSQNWHLYAKANNANGALQVAVELYKSCPKGVDPLVLEMLAKSDAWSQDVFKDIVRQIQLAEKEFSYRVITRWVDEGRVTKDHAQKLFRGLVVEH